MAGAPNLSLNNSQLTSSGNMNLNVTNQFSGKDPNKILEKNSILDALFDSDARYDPPKCHPETRTAVLDHIRVWANNPDSPPVIWIRGGAGAGKSAISQTLSEGWDEESILAASFYFSRTAPGRNEKKHIIATLAYQLAGSIPSTRPLIEDAIRRSPKIFGRNLRTQMKQLIINPLVTIAQKEPTSPMIVVIDGLDECCIDYPNQNFEQQQKEILESIYSAVTHHKFPLRFLIASRPERQIREMFEHGLLEPISSRLVLDDSHNPSADIELYLRCMFEEIKRTHPHLESQWPPDDVIPRLVSKSSGHFIYAAVVVRYLKSPRIDPSTGLNTLLDINCAPSSESPFAELDALYTHILLSVASESLPIVQNVFGLMLYEGLRHVHWLLNDLNWLSPGFFAKYFFLSLGQLDLHLIDLHSILDIPPPKTAGRSPITFLHASFSEYLTQPNRSQQFHIAEAQALRRILSFSIRHLYIQILSSDNGVEAGYYFNGFPLQTLRALQVGQPDDDILQALRALVDEDEGQFMQYVNAFNLSQFGTARRSIEAFEYLYNVHNAQDRSNIIEYLTKHSIQGFVPVEYPPRPDLNVIEQPPDTAAPQEQTSSVAAAQDSTSAAREEGHVQRPAGAELIEQDVLGADHENDMPLIEPNLTSKGAGARFAHKETLSTSLRQIVGVGLRPMSPASFILMTRTRSVQPDVEDQSSITLLVD